MFKMFLKYRKYRNVQCFFFIFAKLSSIEFFIIGAVAKAAATIITYPLQTMQSILRVGFYARNLEGLFNILIC